MKPGPAIPRLTGHFGLKLAKEAQFHEYDWIGIDFANNGFFLRFSLAAGARLQAALQWWRHAGVAAKPYFGPAQLSRPSLTHYKTFTLFVKLRLGPTIATKSQLFRLQSDNSPGLATKRTPRQLCLVIDQDCQSWMNSCTKSQVTSRPTAYCTRYVQEIGDSSMLLRYFG